MELTFLKEPVVGKVLAVVAQGFQYEPSSVAFSAIQHITLTCLDKRYLRP